MTLLQLQVQDLRWEILGTNLTEPGINTRMADSWDRLIFERLARGQGALSISTTVFEVMDQGTSASSKEAVALTLYGRYGREKLGARKMNTHFH